jgi:hypothetical protein
MGPDDIPVHDLLGHDDSGEPGPDELRAIVSRASRHRLRRLSAGMLSALVVGGLVGYLVSNQTSSPSQTAVSPAAAPNNSSTTVAGGPEAAVGSINSSSPGISSSSSSSSSGVVEPAIAYTHLFTRTAGDVTIRGFLTNFPGSSAGPACVVGPPQFEAELSTAQMVGTVDALTGGRPSTNSVASVQTSVVGSAEGDPVAVVTAEAGLGVKLVKASFVGGSTDSMAPVRGWVALAAPVSARLSYGKSLGHVTALGSAGNVLSTTDITLGSGLPVPAACNIGGCPEVQPAQTGAAAGVSGRGTASSGSSSGPVETTVPTTTPTCGSCGGGVPSAGGSTVGSSGGQSATAGGSGSASGGGSASTGLVNPGGPMIACAPRAASTGQAPVPMGAVPGSGSTSNVAPATTADSSGSSG